MLQLVLQRRERLGDLFAFLLFFGFGGFANSLVNIIDSSSLVNVSALGDMPRKWSGIL